MKTFNGQLTAYYKAAIYVSTLGHLMHNAFEGVQEAFETVV